MTVPSSSRTFQDARTVRVALLVPASAAKLVAGVRVVVGIVGVPAPFPPVGRGLVVLRPNGVVPAASHAFALLARPALRPAVGHAVDLRLPARSPRPSPA
jgi:hypothetical protein